MYDNMPEKVKHKLSSNFSVAPPCTNDNLIWNYLNSKKVQQALHVTLPIGKKWQLCSDDVYERYHKSSEPIEHFFADFWTKIPTARVMLYAGDIDIACNFLGVEQFSTKLNRTELEPYNQVLGLDFKFLNKFILSYNNNLLLKLIDKLCIT